MAIDTIKFKRGVKSKLNNLSYGEPAYISDENELYIGTENGVEKITRNKEVAELSSQLEHITVLLTSFHYKDESDYTQAFIRALNFLESKGGGTLKVPTGNYKVIPDTILLKSNINIVGEEKSIIYTEYGNVYDFILGQDNSNTISNITIKNITFNQFEEIGKITDVDNARMYCIRFFNATDVIIENNRFNGVGRNTLVINGRYCKDVIIRNNKALYKRVSKVSYDCSVFYINTQHHTIENNEIICDESDSLMIGGGIESHTSNGIVRNNKIIRAKNGFHISNHKYESNYTKIGQNVYNNVVSECLTGIRVWPNLEDNGIDNITITDNKIFQISISNAICGYGIGVNSAIEDGSGNTTLAGYVKGLYIKNNIISHKGNVEDYEGDNSINHYNVAGINLYTSANITDCYVENNTIIKSPVCPLTIGSTISSWHNNIFIKNNTFDDCCYYSVSNADYNEVLAFIKNVTNIYITDNTIIYGITERIKRRWGYVYVHDNVLGKIIINNNKNIKNGTFETIYTRVKTDIDNREVDIDYSTFNKKTNIHFIDSINTEPTETYLRGFDYFISTNSDDDYKFMYCREDGTMKTINANVLAGEDESTFVINDLTGTINIDDYLSADGSGSYRVVCINGDAISLHSVSAVGATILTNKIAKFTKF